MAGVVEREIIDLLGNCGVPRPDEVADTLAKYLTLILEANERINLTRIVDWDDALRLHVLDSLTCLPEVLRAVDGDLCDIGTGGGFPGVPLGLASGRSTLLVDSVAKKCKGVTEVLEAGNLGGGFECRAARAEELALAEPQRFAVVVCRAVAPLGSLVELAAPLLAMGGSFIALKGDPDSAELESGRAVARLVGLEPSAERRIVLPVGDETRTILTYMKTGKGSVKVPRRVGLAQNHPLA